MLRNLFKRQKKIRVTFEKDRRICRRTFTEREVAYESVRRGLSFIGAMRRMAGGRIIAWQYK